MIVCFFCWPSEKWVALKRAVHPPAFFSDAFFCFTIVEMQKDVKKKVLIIVNFQIFASFFFGSDAKIPRRPFCGICGGQNPAVVAAKRKFLPDEVGEVFFFFRLQRISNAVWVGTLVLPGNSAIVTLLACFSDPLNGMKLGHESRITW